MHVDVKVDVDAKGKDRDKAKVEERDGVRETKRNIHGDHTPAVTIGRLAFRLLAFATLSPNGVGAVPVRNKVSPTRRLVPWFQPVARHISTHRMQTVLFKKSRAASAAQARYCKRTQSKAARSTSMGSKNESGECISISR